MLNKIKAQFEIRSECWWPQTGNMDDEVREQQTERERKRSLNDWRTIKTSTGHCSQLQTAHPQAIHLCLMHIAHKNSKSFLKTSICGLIVNTISGSQGAQGFDRPTGKQSCVYKVLGCCNDEHFLERARMDLQGFRRMKSKSEICLRHLYGS